MSKESKTSATKPEWKGPFSVFELAYNRMLGNIKPVLFFVGIYTAAAIISMLLQGVDQTDKSYKPYADALYLVFILPIIVYSLALADNKKLSIDQFTQVDFRRLLTLIFAGLLSALLVIGGAILLIIPLYWVIPWVSFVSYVVVDKGLSPRAAIEESKRLADGHKNKVWALVGVSILLSFVGAIVSVIPFIGVAAVAFVSVLTTVAAAIMYRWLQATA